MLKFIRRNASAAWVKFIFVAIVVVFVFWGMGGIVRGQKAQVVARVNQDAIAPADFYRAYNNLLRLYQDIYKDSFKPELMKGLDLKGKALDQLIRVYLLRQEARRLGLRAGDSEVRESIANVPAFQQNGVFSKDLYLRVLQANRITPGEFEEAKEEELLVDKLQSLILGGVHVSEAEVHDRYRLENEQVNLRFIRLDAAAFAPDVKLTDEDMQAYFDKNRETFREPEKVRIEYVSYEPDKFAGQAQVSDAEVKAYYDEHIAEYEKPEEGQEPARTQTLDEVRPQIIAKLTQSKARDLARERAEAARVKVAGGETLAGAAQASALSVATPPPFGQQEAIAGIGRNAGLSKAAFAAAAGDVGPVIDTPQGFVLFRLAERLSAHVPELSAIRDRVGLVLRNERADAVAKSTAEAVLAELQKNPDLDAAAKTHQVKIDETGVFARSASAVPKIGAAQELKKDAFQLTPEKPVAPAVYPVLGGSVVAVLKERLPADEEKFNSEKDTLMKQAEDRGKAQVLDQFFNSLIARASIERNDDFLAAVADTGHEIDPGGSRRR